MYTNIKHAVPKKISKHDSSEKKVQSATPGQQTCNPHQEHLHHQQLLDCGNWLHHFHGYLESIQWYAFNLICENKQKRKMFKYYFSRAALRQ